MSDAFLWWHLFWWNFNFPCKFLKCSNLAHMFLKSNKHENRGTRLVDKVHGYFIHWLDMLAHEIAVLWVPTVGVAEIIINSQPCKGINLTTWYMRAKRAQRVATIHNVIKESDRVLPRSSVMFNVYALVGTPWVAGTLSHCTTVKQGKVSLNSVTLEATKFAGPHKSRMR
jgi:hypothetical protein